MRTTVFLAAGLMVAATTASAQRVREDRIPYHCALICTGSSAIEPPLSSATPVQPRPLTPRSLDDVIAAARGDATAPPIRAQSATMPSPTCTIVVIVPRPCATAP